MITFEQINAFRAVIDNKSYSAGGRAIGKDRTTVREHILALEDILGKSLFVIQGKKALPTEFALYLYPRARHLAKQAEDFERVALSAQDMAITELTICYDVQIPTAFLGELDAMIAKAYPSLLVHWLHRNRQDALTSLEKGEMQLALMPNLADLLPSERVGIMNIGASKLGVYVHPASSLAQQARVSLRDLARFPQWLSEDVILMDKRIMQVSPQRQMVSNSDLAVRLIANRGWTILNVLDGSQYEQLGLVKRLQLDEMAQTFHSGVSLFYSYAVENNPTMAAIIDIVRTCSQKYLN